MRLFFTILLYLNIIILGLSCKTSYLDNTKPLWINNKYPSKSLRSDSIKIISYNIEKSQNIEKIISELQSNTNLQDPDIILLQEMDEKGVIKISEALNLNYVYYPISKYKNRNAGNAILSNQFIEACKKIILPHKTQFGEGKRISCAAIFNINKKSVLVQSIHLETIIMSRAKRIEQLESILKQTATDNDIKYHIIGGDFNTMYKKDFSEMNQILNEAGFNSNTDDIGKTGSVPFNIIKPQLDHIYSKGFEFIDSGKCDSCGSSDHLPIWAKIKFQY